RWRVEAALCAAGHDDAGALAAARQLEAVADRASLAEWRCEALWLLARLADGDEAQRARQAAVKLAAERGFGWLAPAAATACSSA
ncbi:MAG: hypothetical protein J0L57_19105, partial [Burkholderiales bacterium]|nr:hypothetical protein [Burkholderiales bacterium]